MNRNLKDYSIGALAGTVTAISAYFIAGSVFGVSESLVAKYEEYAAAMNECLAPVTLPVALEDAANREAMEACADKQPKRVVYPAAFGYVIKLAGSAINPPATPNP